MRLEVNITMKKQIGRVLLCVLLVFAAVVLTACGNEAAALQERIDTLEAENTELQSTISSLRNELDGANANLSSTRTELQILQAFIAAQDDDDDQSSQQGSSGSQGGALAITYGGQANADMTWDLDFGELPLGLINYGELDDDVEIVWHSTNENVFTVEPSDDGTSAVVTPKITGQAELVVTVGDRTTRSWVRIV